MDSDDIEMNPTAEPQYPPKKYPNALYAFKELYPGETYDKENKTDPHHIHARDVFKMYDKEHREAKKLFKVEHPTQYWAHLAKLKDARMKKAAKKETNTNTTINFDHSEASKRIMEGQLLEFHNDLHSLETQLVETAKNLNTKRMKLLESFKR